MRARRVDDNHNEIIAAIRATGIRLFDSSAFGQGFPDAVCSYGGRSYLVEFKDATKPKADRQLTKSQVKFHEAWLAPIAVVSTIDEALAWCEQVKSVDWVYTDHRK